MVEITLIEEKPSPTITLQTSLKDYDPLIAAAAKKYSLDPLMLQALMRVESGGNAKAQGPEVTRKGAYNPATGEHNVIRERAGGLFQIMPGTARDLGITDVFDPEQNVNGGARYLRQLLDHPSAKGDMSTALMFYHGGTNPNNWGEKSLAYPGKVLGAYRQLGGRLNDPAVPEGSFWQRTAAAALPFDLVARTALGSGADLSQGPSGPEGNRPVGAKIGDWWNNVSPKRETFQRSMDNYAENNPLLAATADILGSLPTGLGFGNLLTAGLKGTRMLPGLDRLGSYLAGPTGQVPGGIAPAGATAAVAPWRTFAAGGAGRGLPGTGEGANLATRALSGATSGALQGGAQGAGYSFLQEGQSPGEGAAIGSLVGGAVGGTLPLVGAAANRIIFGKRIAPETAELGQEFRAGRAAVPPVDLVPGMAPPSREALTGTLGRPAVPLTPSLDQVNQLALDPQQFSRVVGEMLGETAPFQVTGGRLTRARTAIGERIETSLPDLYMAVDKEFMSGFRNLLAEAQQDPNLVAELKKLPALKKLWKDFSYAATMTDGMLPGADYQKLIQSGIKNKTPGLVTVLTKNSNSAVADFGSALRTLMDEGVLRGTQESIEIALARGDIETAQKVQKAFSTYTQARQQWKMLDPIEKALDPVTQRIRPDRLYTGAERVGGDLEQLARGALAFDPENLARNTPFNLPYTAAAAGGGMVAQDAVTTGKAALAMVALNKLGRLGKAGIQQIPGYTSGLLARSSHFGPGPTESALRTLGLPAGVMAGVRNNPLLQESEQR